MKEQKLKLAICGNREQVAEFTECFKEFQVEEIELGIENDLLNQFDALFILNRDYTNLSEKINIPVFINEVEKTISELGLAMNVIRINLWPGFTGNKLWEITGVLSSEAQLVLEKLNKEFIQLPDEAGLLSARVLALIINEAYFAIGDGVSTAAEIDTAMKLGTNYPYGPIEWAEKIGIENIYTLLSTLAKSNEKYFPAPLLCKSFN